VKALITLVGCGMLVGCAAQRAPTPTAQAAIPPTASVPLGSSSALLFTPPLARYSPPLNLDRTGRGQAAFVGFEQATTSSYDIYTYNRASTDGFDTYDRYTFVNRGGSLSR
jgi:hypothetical protein